MTVARLGCVVFGAGLLGSCTTMRAMDAPASPARIVAAAGGPEQVLWAFESSLPAGETARKAHMQRYEVARPVPVSLSASPGEYLWIVPVCNGATRWDRSAAYQLHRGEMTVRVSC